MIKGALWWAWRNRRGVLGYLAGTVLLCKWAFGYVSTDKLIELVRAMASVLNPITLF
jgi:hypothetical protein